MEESHFSTVIRLQDASPGAGKDDQETYQLRVGDERGSLTVTPTKLQQEEPHPAAITELNFDEVFPPCVSQERDIYQKSVSPLVKSVLEGFNGTVISLDYSQNGGIAQGLVTRAARNIFHTLKKLSKSGLTAKLVVPCTFVLLCEEVAYDLLCDLPTNASSTGPVEITGERAILTNLASSVTSETKRASDVTKLLEHGETIKKQVLSSSHESSGRLHYHTVFTIGIKFTEFGTSFAPLSGTLTFVGVNKPDSLDVEEVIAAGPTAALSTKSINDFILTLHEQTRQIPYSDSPKLSRQSSRQQDQSQTRDRSVLMEILQEAIGGNCKTLLVCHAPVLIGSSHHSQCISLLQLLSHTRRIENKPDKTELAKKALMDAYMKELRKLYGNTTSGSREEETLMEDVAISTSANKDAELAAKALASAAQGKDDGSESEDSDASDDESGLKKSVNESSSHASGPKSRRFTLTKKDNPAVMAATLESASTSSFYSKAVDLTIEALVAVIQEPDKGVPRALTGALEHVKIRTGKGALFSGADIVTWLIKNVAGVDTEEDAEQIGQILLDKEAIFHSEGSSVFANSVNLFYYARDSRPVAKPLTEEEIHALLAHDKQQPNVQVMKVNEHDRKQQESKKRPLKTEQQLFHVEETDSSIRASNNKDSDVLTSDESELTTLQAATTDTSNSLPLNTLTPHTISGQQRPNTLPPIVNKPEETLSSDESHSTLVAVTSPSIAETTKSATSPSMAETTKSDVDHMGLEESTGHQKDRHVSTSDSQDDENEEDELSETTEVPSIEKAPNLNAIARVPDLQTLEKYSDYPHPLHLQAATSNQAGVIKHLIHWYGVDQLDERDRTPLMFATLGNKASSCRTLIEYGSVLDRRDKSGLTAVHIACYHGHKEALTVLVNKSANIAIRDKMLHTAFHWSTVPVTTHCLRILLRHSQRCNLERDEDKSGLTPVHWAIFYDHAEHLKLLLPRCTDLKRLDSCGRTFAIYSIQKEKLHCLEYLLKECPELADTPDKHNLTPLHHASALSSTSYLLAIIRTIQATGRTLNCDTKDQYGRTPVHYAVLYGRPESLNLLLKHGANPCPKDYDGRSPLDLSKEFGVEENETIQKLLENGPINAETDGGLSKQDMQSAVCQLL